LSDWNVSSGTHFSYMFSYATSFNRNLCDWNIQNGATFDNMFTGSACDNLSDPSDDNVCHGCT